jgi:hypothetical protein
MVLVVGAGMEIGSLQGLPSEDCRLSEEEAAVAAEQADAPHSHTNTQGPISRWRRGRRRPMPRHSPPDDVKGKKKGLCRKRGLGLCPGKAGPRRATEVVGEWIEH